MGPTRLIVNADDFGRSEIATDRTIEGFRRGVITCASLMVGMKDTRRAVALARELDMPLGLHLNLTEAFSDPSLPQPLRARHNGVVGIARSRGTRFRYPRLRAWSLLERAIADQVRLFKAVAERDLSRIDGHHLVHLSPHVLLSPSLPSGVQVRRPLEAAPSAGLTSRAARSGVAILLRKRFRVTDAFLGLYPLGPPTSWLTLLDAALERRAGQEVELMVHPADDAEWRFLTSQPVADLFDPLCLTGPRANQVR